MGYGAQKPSPEQVDGRIFSPSSRKESDGAQNLLDVYQAPVRTNSGYQGSIMDASPRATPKQDLYIRSSKREDKKVIQGEYYAHYLQLDKIIHAQKLVSGLDKNEIGRIEDEKGKVNPDMMNVHNLAKTGQDNKAGYMGKKESDGKSDGKVVKDSNIKDKDLSPTKLPIPSPAASKISVGSQHADMAPPGEAHDEMLFIIVHQSYELWFKQILWEINSVIDMMSHADGVREGDIGLITHRLHRVTKIQEVLISQIGILETVYW